VQLTLEVTSPAAPLADSAGRLTDTLTYTVTAVDLQKKKATATMSREARVGLSPPTDGVQPAQVSYQISTSMRLRPAHYQLRVAVTSQRLGVGGSVYLLLDVPEFSKEPLVLSGPLLSSRLTPAIPRAVAVGAQALPFQPTLNREFPPDDELRLYWRVARKTAAPVAVRASVEDDRKHVLLSETWTMPADQDSLEVQLPLRTLAPGGYSLRIVAESRSLTTERNVPLVIR
jgi:hypothetical protein